ncbi:MAG: hypothetical protein Q8P15_03125 [Nanoarchaeota archaeon]|nr:hypothetical protein [Nanoarchaeota archaeon]
MVEKFQEFFWKAEKKIQTLDHLVYVTYPLVKDKKLLLKILVEIKEAVVFCINSVLQYEYLHKQISLSKDSKENFKIFREKCSVKYKITEKEIDLITELFNLVQKHKESNFEFVRKEKIVILSENMKTELVTIEKIKDFLLLSKNILKKVKDEFLGKI